MASLSAELLPAGVHRGAAVAPGASRADATFIALHLVTWLSFAAQLFIDPRYDNALGAVLVLASASITFLYVQRTHALREVPFSTIALLGLCFTTQWGALIGQSVLRDSLTFKLSVPLQTFGFLAGFQAVAIAAHWVSRRLRFFMSARAAVARVVLRPLGVFTVPGTPALWLMGAVGLASTLGSAAGGGGLLSKIADGFGPMAWAPFTIPLLYLRHGSAYCRLARQLPLLAGFGTLAILLGFALNARSIMLAGFMTAILLGLVHLLADERPFRATQLKYAAIAVLVGALLYQPVTYLVTAVQIAREQRDKIDKLQMLQHTLEVLQDLVSGRRSTDLSVPEDNTAAYSEIYFKSSTLGRLVETKFHDNGFYMVQGVSALESRLVADDASDRVWSILPYPVLKWLGLERAKLSTLYSVGDFLSYLRFGDELGSFRTGSMFAQAIAIFGVWTPFLYFLLCLPLFVVVDALALPARGAMPAAMSVIGMLLIYRLFTWGIVNESINAVLATILRNQLQNVLLYALLFAATRIVFKPFVAPASLPAGDLPAQAAKASP